MGLTSEQAAQRLARDGANALDAAEHRSVWSRLWAMLREPMFALLVLAASLYLVLGDLTEGLTLFVFVLAVLALTFYQEGKSEAAIDALRQLSQPFAQVLRDGQRICVPSRDVVGAPPRDGSPWQLKQPCSTAKAALALAIGIEKTPHANTTHTNPPRKYAN